MARFKFPIFLALLLCISAFLLVNSQYRARKLFIELEIERAKTHQLEVEWSQLQLKQSTLSKHARIEEKAIRELNMVRITSASTLFLKMTQP